MAAAIIWQEFQRFASVPLANNGDVTIICLAPSPIVLVVVVMAVLGLLMGPTNRARRRGRRRLAEDARISCSSSWSSSSSRLLMGPTNRARRRGRRRLAEDARISCSSSWSSSSSRLLMGPTNRARRRGRRRLAEDAGISCSSSWSWSSSVWWRGQEIEDEGRRRGRGPLDMALNR